MKKRTFARGRAKAGLALELALALACALAGAAMAAEADAEAVAGAADGPQEAFMQAALEEAYAGIEAGDGGPFGTVIVKDGEIVGRGHNRVVVNQDPTCHGEMEAIRDACKNLGTFDLSGCELYTTAEPCPMCLGAILWSNISATYYGCTRQDSAEIGFRDDAFYRQLSGEEETVDVQEFDRDACRELFDDYAAGDAQRY